MENDRPQFSKNRIVIDVPVSKIIQFIKRRKLRKRQEKIEKSRQLRDHLDQIKLDQ